MQLNSPSPAQPPWLMKHLVWYHSVVR